MSTIPETISLLEQYNKWRRGDDTITMPDSFELGVAIGDAVRILREHATLTTEFHALTLICGTSDANKFQSWVDREREKVRVLREALELITNQADACKAFCDTFTPASRIKARAALEATEEDSK